MHAKSSGRPSPHRGGSKKSAREKLLSRHLALRRQHTQLTNQRRRLYESHQRRMGSLIETPTERRVEGTRATGDELRNVDFRLGAISSQISDVEREMQNQGMEAGKDFNPWEPHRSVDNGKKKS